MEGESLGFTVTDIDDVRNANPSEAPTQKSVPVSEQFLPNFER